MGVPSPSPGVLCRPNAEDIEARVAGGAPGPKELGSLNAQLKCVSVRDKSVVIDPLHLAGRVSEQLELSRHHDLLAPSGG